MFIFCPLTLRHKNVKLELMGFEDEALSTLSSARMEALVIKVAKAHLCSLNMTHKVCPGVILNHKHVNVLGEFWAEHNDEGIKS